MQTLRCPIVDQLVHDLIEAYRHAEDLKLLNDRPTREVEHIQNRMLDHRLTCVICQHDVAFREMAGQMAVTYY